MENVKELVSGIRAGLSQKSASQKDELRVMKAMLNDRDYEVTVYGGAENETFCPAREAREMISGGAVSINNAKCTDLDKIITEDDAIEGKVLLIKKGKKNYYLGLMKA